MRFLVTGAAGFIGSHLTDRLVAEGHWVRGVDFRNPEFSPSTAHDFVLTDLRDVDSTQLFENIDGIFALAADMGGMGRISTKEATLLYNNTLIDIHTLEQSRRANIPRFVYASSACVYPRYLQMDAVVEGLREDQAFPADPDGAYGFEKLYGEQACAHYAQEHGMNVAVARLHNIYGPRGTFQGGREKAPAALCRKVALAEPGSSIEIWGDGKQTRSFCYVDDCVEGLIRLFKSNQKQPLNIGSSEAVSVDGLADIIIRASGKTGLELRYIDGPQGVRGRNSDNSLAKETLDWSPQVDLTHGIQETYNWIRQQVTK